MKNYDNHLFRVSALDNITAGLTTFDKKYEQAEAERVELSAKVDKYRDEYRNMNQSTKTAEKKLNTLNNASEKLDVLQMLVNSYRANLGKVAISEGCKTHLTDIWIANEFGRVKDIKNKYLEKGLLNEEAGITMYGACKGRFMEKNMERKDDGFITGEMDVEDEKLDLIVDIKNSWNLYTFFKNIKYIDNQQSSPYYAQAQGYMKLWKKEKARIVYTLIDTPQNLIEDEKRRLKFDFVGTQKDYEEACEELEYTLKFSDIDPKRRVIEIPIDRDEEFISIIQPTVIACREFLNNFKEVYYEMD